MKIRSATPADCLAIAELALAVDGELISIMVFGINQRALRLYQRHG
jgi:hypothetical protein